MEYDEATIEQATEFLIEYCNSVDQETIDAWNSRTDFAVETELYNSGLPFTPESFLGALDSWQSGIDECGAYIEHGDFTYEADGGRTYSDGAGKVRGAGGQSGIYL